MRSSDAAHAVISLAGPLVSRGQLVAAGVDYRWLRRQVAAGVWRELFPGVFWTAPRRVGAFEYVRAALVFAGDDAALAGRSALDVWQGLTAVREPVEVSVPHGRTVRRAEGVIVHQRRGHDLRSLAGMLIASPAQAVVDLVGVLEVNDVRCHAAEAVRTGLMRPDALLDRAVVPQRARGVIRMIDEELRAGAISGGECGFYRLVKVAGLPLPQLNVPITTDDGNYRLDAHWKCLRLAVEIDGRSVHAKQEAFESDRARQNAIHIEGVLMLRFPVSLILSEPERVAATMDRALRARAAELKMPWLDVVRSCRRTGCVAESARDSVSMDDPHS